MKQFILSLLCLCIAQFSSAQLDQYISKDSKVVVEISGDQIFDLLPVTDIAEMLPPDPSGMPMDISNLGININSKAYYFYQLNDSVAYHNMIFAINDITKAQELITQSLPAPPMEINGFQYASQGNMTAAWNNSMAVFTYADIPKVVYTMEDIIANREQEALDNEENSTDEEQEVEEYDDYDSDRELKGDAESEELEFELMMKNLSAPYIYDDQEMEEKLKMQFSSIVNNQAQASVNTVDSYNNSKKSNASFYYWVNNFDEMVGDMMGDMSDLMSIGAELPSMMAGFNEVTGNLVFENDKIVFNTDMVVNSSLAESYRKMTTSDMDEAFLKYFNQDDVISYLSYNTDTKVMLEEYPSFMQKMYGGMFPNFTEEMDLGADIFSTIIDEEAIAEMITGDALILLHDIDEHEVPFTTYKYDDEFNSIEVDSTKMEPLPIFTAMIGSKNKRIINKLLKIASKYEVVDKQDGVQRFKIKDMGSPFDLYFVHSEDIAFLTNSPERVVNYKLGKNISNLGSHEKSLKGNIFNIYMNMSNMVDEFSTLIPADEKSLAYFQENFKDITFSSGKMEGNSIGYDMVMNTNGTRHNSLKLLVEAMGVMQGKAPK